MGKGMSSASVPETTSGFEFRCSDLDEFREVISRRIRPAEFRSRATRHDATLRQHRVGNLGFSVIRVDPGIAVAVDPVDDSYLFQAALTGAFTARCRGRERSYGEGDVHVVNPAAPLRLSISPPCTIMVIR